jgi:hypothetical protein
MECVEKIIKKDWCHPLTGEKLKEQDIIPLQRVITVALSYDDLTVLMLMSIIYNPFVLGRQKRYLLIWATLISHILTQKSLFNLRTL